MDLDHQLVDYVRHVFLRQARRPQGKSGPTTDRNARQMRSDGFNPAARLRRRGICLGRGPELAQLLRKEQPANAIVAVRGAHQHA